jgi:DNA-binding transcriptional regulator LsrR (DeoR family)
MTQTQIAKELGVHISQVSRYLKEARERKLVRIVLDLPREEELQLRLMREFNLQDAVVVPLLADKTIDELSMGEDTPLLRETLGRRPTT